ncbi:MAG: oligopeptide/dipeptide ABC transporter ATP-binding protein, partial [Candidatus Acidiferrales bacterium]
PYTEGLLRAAPRLERGKLVPIPGAVPRLDELPPGCAFAPRCPLHRAECDAAVPDLRATVSESSSGNSPGISPGNSPEHRARCILVP